MSLTYLIHQSISKFSMWKNWSAIFTMSKNRTNKWMEKQAAGQPCFSIFLAKRIEWHYLVADPLQWWWSQPINAWSAWQVTLLLEKCMGYTSTFQHWQYPRMPWSIRCTHTCCPVGAHHCGRTLHCSLRTKRYSCRTRWISPERMCLTSQILDWCCASFPGIWTKWANPRSME